jgi:hypothetical protein
MEQETLPKKPDATDFTVQNFRIHADIKKLLWFGDGPLKNFFSKLETFPIGLPGMGKQTITGWSAEPSCIYSGALVKEPADASVIPRPPYSPHYVYLKPEQRWIYLNFLADPYNKNIDIGYVFLLYYGLERHLMFGDFDSAFRVILKLRGVHKHKSFQKYSGNALILSALYKKKGEYIPLFMNSLNNENEFNVPDNLLLMCYYSFNVPLLPRDIMRMAKTIYEDMYYIKKRPDIFEQCLGKIIKERTGSESIDLRSYFTESELKKISYERKDIFANIHANDDDVRVPRLADIPDFKKDMLVFLLLAREEVKSELAEAKKAGRKKP